MSKSALLGLMALIEGGAGLFLLLRPGVARRQLLGDALPLVSDVGLQVSGLCLLGLGVMCLFGSLNGGSRRPFAIMLAYNSLAAAGLAGIGMLGGQAGPGLWPTVVLHAALVGLQLRAMRTG
jgi:uncharacterized protein YjeT (DUF2065 family)